MDLHEPEAVTQDPKSPISAKPSDVVNSRSKRTKGSRVSKSCHTCTVDKQKCVRSRGSDAKCDRCESFEYVCSNAPQISSSGSRQRRKLTYHKCEFCRRDRKKCSWTSGEWSESNDIRCDYCTTKDFACSEPQVVPRKKYGRGNSSRGSSRSTRGRDVQAAKHYIAPVSDPYHYRDNAERSDDEESALNRDISTSAYNSPSMGPPPPNLAQSSRQRTSAPYANASPFGPGITSVEPGRKRLLADVGQGSDWELDDRAGLTHSRRRGGEYDYEYMKYSGYPDRQPPGRPSTFCAATISQQSSWLTQPQTSWQVSPGVSRPFVFSPIITEPIPPQMLSTGAQFYPSEMSHESGSTPGPSTQGVFTSAPWAEQDTEQSSQFSRKTAPPRSGYKYIPLGKEDEYRLLVLEPGQRDQGIECSLVSSAHFEQKYEAVSYVWGDPLPDCEIKISRHKAWTGGRGAKSLSDSFYITLHLYEALRCLRYPAEPRYLWIDAICIDQENTKEKSQQVRIMAEIYKRANEVLVWLGAPDSTFDTAVKFLKILSHMNLVHLDRIIHDEQYLEKWGALAKVIENQYFRRRWVIQELGFARSAILLSGETEVEWSIFAEGVVFYEHYVERIKQLSHGSTDPNVAQPFDRMSWIHNSGANNLIVTLNRVFHRSIDGVVYRRVWKLIDLVLRLTQFDCSDPRDIIYAVLSLAKENDEETSLASPRETLLLKPDYEKSVSEVFIEFVEFYVRSTQSLDIICRQWAVGARQRSLGAKASFFKEYFKSPLPSWILLRSEHANHISGNTFIGDDPADSIYNAASRSKPEVLFERIEGRLNGIMTVKGVRLASIGSLGDRVLQGVITAESLGILGWNVMEYDLRKPVLARLWRTMVADRSLEGVTPPSWYQKACKSTLLRTSSSGDIDTQKLITARDMPPTIVEFLERVRRVVWNRKFLLSNFPTERLRHAGELFGIAPKGAREGDLICILFGCSVPVILRERKTGAEAFFEFVGDAYIHGMMEGEAFTDKNAAEVKSWTEIFKLR